MTPRITRFNLKEISRFRVVCKNCSTVIEMPAKKTRRLAKDGYCPNCKEYIFDDETAKNIVIGLGNLFDMLDDVKSADFELEFDGE